MQTLILKSENKKILNAIKTLAKVLDIQLTEKETDDYANFEIRKDVKISKAKRKFIPKKLAGTLTDLNLEEPSIIRKKAWTRRKASY